MNDFDFLNAADVADTAVGGNSGNNGAIVGAAAAATITAAAIVAATATYVAWRASRMQLRLTIIQVTPATTPTPTIAD